MQPLLGQRVFERAHHVLLPHHLGKRAGTPLAGEDLGHGDSAVSERWAVSGILPPTTRLLAPVTGYNSPVTANREASLTPGTCEE